MSRRRRPRAASALFVAAVASLLLAAPARAQSLPSIKFPGPAATPVGPGLFVAQAGSIVRWYVVFDNTIGLGDITLNYVDVMDATINCDAFPVCQNAGELELLCDPPNAPDPAGGVVTTCDTTVGRLDIRNVSVLNGTSTCISFSTRVRPTAITAGMVGNIGCVEVVAPVPSSGHTTPTTSSSPACVPVPSSDPMPGCSLISIPSSQPPMFSGRKTATVEDVNANGVTDVGDRITWTIVMSNDAADAHDAWVFDTIPTGTTFVDITQNPDSDCTLVGAEIQCPMLHFLGSETKTLAFRTDFACSAATDDDSFQACNQASICTDGARTTCFPSDNDAMLPPAPTCVTFNFSDFKTSAKSWTFSDDDMDGSLSAGDRITYTIRVRNSGTRKGERVTVSDTLDASCLDLATVDPVNGSYDSAAGRITWVLGDMPPGDLQELTFSVRGRGAAGTICCNQAQINSDERVACMLAPIPTNDAATPAPSDPTCANFGPQPVVRVEKGFVITNDVDGDGFPDSGDTLEFTITIVNTGAGPATSVSLDDPLSACWMGFLASGVVITGAGTNASVDPPTPPVNGGRVVVNGIGGADGLAPRSAETVTVRYSVQLFDVGGAGCCNRADVRFAESQIPARSDNPATPFPGDATCSNPAAQRARLLVTKTMADVDGDGCLEAGENLTFTITVTVRDDNASFLMVTDQLTDPSNALTVVDPGTGAYDASMDRITWDLGSRLQDESITRTWIGRFDCDAVSGQSVNDLASALAMNAPVSSAGLTSTLSTPDVVVTKTEAYDDVDTSGDFSAGDVLTYTITVTNAGSCAARDVVLTDPIDHDLDVASLVTTGPAINDGMGGLRWDQSTIPAFATLDPGVSRQFTVRGTVLDPRTNTDPAKDGIVANVALASARSDFACAVGGTSPLLQDNIAVPSARLDVVEAVRDQDGNGCFEPGDVLTFTLDVTAVGGAASDVVVVDTLRNSGGFIVVGDTGGGVYDPVASTIKWSLGVMTAGEMRHLQWTGTIACDAADASPFSDLADASSSSVPGGQDLVDSVVSTAVIEILKDFTWVDDGDGVIEPGEVLKYRITITNTGSCTARGVFVTDTIDADLDRANAVPSGMGTVDASGTVSWLPGEPPLTAVPPGGTGTLTLIVPVLDPLTNPDPDHDGSVANTAQATLPSVDCPPAVTSGAATSFTINGQIGQVRILRNDYISCLQGATAAMRLFLRPRPVPQECSEPPAIDEMHQSTQVVSNAVSPWPFRGDADPSSSLPACPQSAIGFGRVMVFYELDDPPPACITTLRVMKGAGGDVVLTW